MGCGARPRRPPRIDALDTAGALAGSAADAVTDLHGSAEYKAYLVGVLLRRAFEQAYQQAIGGDVGEAARGRGTA